MNLTRNAVEHTARTTTDRDRGAVDGREASIWVADSGTGCSRTRSGESSTASPAAAAAARRYEGSGLGLAIVRAIAEAHGGRVELDSRPGRERGSTDTAGRAGPATDDRRSRW